MGWCISVRNPVLTSLTTSAGSNALTQLYFAPQIIKIHLLVFENELFEDAMPVPKKFQNRKPVFYTWMSTSMYSYVHT